jgi:hypothetical protein
MSQLGKVGGKEGHRKYKEGHQKEKERYREVVRLP